MSVSAEKMSTFHEKIIETKSSVTCMKWKENLPSYLSVGTSSGEVEFYWSDGKKCEFPVLEYKSKIKKDKLCVISLLFHPIYNTLIIIWSNGIIRSWNNEYGIISSQMSVHTQLKDNKQIILQFNKYGNRLLTTDFVCYLIW